MRFWQRQQLIIVIIAVLVAAWFVFVEYCPLQKKKRAAEEAKLEQTAFWLKTDAEIKQLPHLRAYLGELRSTVVGYEDKVPRSMGLGLFLQQVADVMNKYRLKEQLVEPAGEVAMERLNCIPINMKCTGKLRQIFDFFKSLEGLDRAICIERVELTGHGDFNGEVSMQMRVDIFYTPVGEYKI